MEKTKKWKFTTPDKIEHNFYWYCTQDISDLFGYQCLFEDSLIHQDTTNLYRESSRAILDIDLDFFTYRNNEIYPKHSDDILKQINSESFNKLLKKSSVISIALEPCFCGCINYSLEIIRPFVENHFKSIKEDIIGDINKTFK